MGVPGEAGGTDAARRYGFRLELEGLINRCSMENGSDTPDFILADYLADCLRAFDRAVFLRSEWYKKGPDVSRG